MTEQVVQQRVDFELVRFVDSALPEDRRVSEGTVHARKRDIVFQVTVKLAIHFEDRIDCVI